MQIDLAKLLPSAALAFRGYNVTNLGRSGELLAHPVYRPIVDRHLRQASAVCGEVAGRSVDLVDRVSRGEETSLETYDEAIALVMAMEMAQLELLQEVHGIAWREARVSFGYSLGEIAAASAGGLFVLADGMRVPLAMAADAADLAPGVMMGVLFSRGEVLDIHAVGRLCGKITAEGRGAIGVSTYLSPNSLLLLGQDDTIDRFAAVLRDVFPRKTHLRKNPDHWPPLHTSIVRQRNISNRASVMMQNVPSSGEEPVPPVLSMVTGKLSYNDYNWREILNQWTDHPQKLWDVVYETLAMGIRTIVHVGPAPNLVPATYQRLADNVTTQMSGRGGWSMRAMAGMVDRPWLSKLLPSRTALLRAPNIRQIVLEDWLLAQPVPT